MPEYTLLTRNIQLFPMKKKTGGTYYCNIISQVVSGLYPSLALAGLRTIWNFNHTMLRKKLNKLHGLGFHGWFVAGQTPDYGSIRSQNTSNFQAVQGIFPCLSNNKLHISNDIYTSYLYTYMGKFIYIKHMRPGYEVKPFRPFHCIFFVEHSSFGSIPHSGITQPLDLL